MSKVVILGATGGLGRHVAREAVSAGHDVAVVVRTPSKLSAEVRGKVAVHPCDLSAVPIGDLTAMLGGHDAVINTAGLVTEGQVFVDLVDRIVTSLEALPGSDRPPAGSSREPGCSTSTLPVAGESTCLASAPRTGRTASTSSAFAVPRWTGGCCVPAPWWRSLPSASTG